MRRSLGVVLLLLACGLPGCGKGCAPGPAASSGGGSAPTAPDEATGKLAPEALGDAIDQGGAGSAPAVAILADENPAVAFLEGGEKNVRVRRWDGAKWESLPPPPGGERGVRVELAGAKDGLVLASLHFTPKDVPAVTVSRWDGTTWTPLGGVLGERPVHDVRVLATPNGAILARIEDSNDGRRLTAHRWDGAAWKPVGAALNAKPGSNVKTLALAGEGDRVVLAWAERVPQQPPSLEVRRLAGDAWEKLPAPEGVDGDTGALGLAPLSDGSLLLAMDGNAGMRPVAHLAKDATAWTSVGHPSASLARAGNVAAVLAPAGGRDAFCVWPSGRMGAARWDGSAWVVLSEELSGAPGTGHEPAIAASAGTFVVAWKESSTQPARIRVARFKVGRGGTPR